MRDQKHSFSLYYSVLSSVSKSHDKIVVTDSDLVHRVTKILRLVVGDELILFDDSRVATGTISLIDKKKFTLDQVSWRHSQDFVPEIVVALGILKRENLENALYSCVELGANTIAPIYFAKSVPQKLNQERIEKILISAAEQSKNFNLPIWHEPILFNLFLNQIKQNLQTTYLYCDVLGVDLLPVVNQLKQKKIAKLVVIIGPEGDLTSEEKHQLMGQSNVITIRLTPTILRSFQATTVVLGVVRALLT